MNTQIGESKILKFIDLLREKLKDYSATDVETKCIVDIVTLLYAFNSTITKVHTQTEVSILAKKTENHVRNIIYNRLSDMPDVNFYTITKQDFDELSNVLEDMHKPRFKYNSETETLTEYNRSK
jgi:hypothetical protein